MSDPTLLVLASLADGAKHGYAMMVDIQSFADIRLGPGTLYGAITRLEQRGWIRPVPSQDRRSPTALPPPAGAISKRNWRASNRSSRLG